VLVADADAWTEWSGSVCSLNCGYNEVITDFFSFKTAVCCHDFSALGKRKVCK
jgi:hypothetical protein